MTIAHLLEDLGHQGPDPIGGQMAPSDATDAIEAARLEAYEEGYKAGWDDAIGANTAEQLQLAADFSQNLRDLAFTYHEAVNHVTQTLGSILEGMLEHFLPEAARLALGPKVLETIADLPLSSETMPLGIAVAPENLRVMEKIVTQSDHKEIDVFTDKDLGPGQVFLRFGHQEVALDFDALLGDLRAALSATFSRSDEEEAANA